MALFGLNTKNSQISQVSENLESFVCDYSIEVMPRTAEKIENFRDILPKNTRVYIAHIEGTPIEDMVKTAKRLAEDGFSTMPHFPARIIRDKATLNEWISRYQGEAGVAQALILAGGISKPHGEYESSMDLLETGLFDRANFKNIHIAGHPEGNKDIDPDGSSKNVDAALKSKQNYKDKTDANMVIATQFAFESGPIIEWANSIKNAGIDIPIHIGIAGPAKLQTLIKFAIACGVGPSLKVLQKRATDVTKLLLPYEPTDVLSQLADHKANNSDFNISGVHFFPLGGIKTNAKWVTENGGTSGIPVNQI
jgi:methylenetetrahydrofolate reductase (NADPH)